MGLNITPKNVFKGTNSDGTKFTINEWDFGTLANLNIASLFVTFIGCVFLCSIAPFIFFIICVFTINGRPQILNILGILFSAYFLIDCYKGWIGTLTLNIVCDESQMKFMIGLNVACLITHLIFLFLTKTLYEYSVGEKLIYFLILMCIFVFSYQLVGKPLAPKLGERVLFMYHSKYHSMEERDEKEAEIKKYENMTDEQIKTEAEDKYYNGLRETDGWTQQQINDDKQRQKQLDKEAESHYW